MMVELKLADLKKRHGRLTIRAQTNSKKHRDISKISKYKKYQRHRDYHARCTHMGLCPGAVCIFDMFRMIGFACVIVGTLFLST